MRLVTQNKKTSQFRYRIWSSAPYGSIDALTRKVASEPTHPCLPCAGLHSIGLGYVGTSPDNLAFPGYSQNKRKHISCDYDTIAEPLFSLPLQPSRLPDLPERGDEY